ncbi:zf-HC2 domain-containing protein [Rhizobium sp. 'Codium 1']|uniref:zf-HC2 domain-containing protein n=1 Tax=Rhizobium sp. 'Codium 1' TaxID=2940484 RepID=UPI001E46F55F|nr:zf-HC2 domain-containing protein [Rhizobium sp. 'Codium 1']MCC8934033.1 zf-HC2 domain-containing protein [Rhizobium sp. 'Codium 1']
MFRCSEVADRASRLIDGELGFWPLLNMRLHLAMCRGCRAFIQQMRTTCDLTQIAGAMQDVAVHEPAYAEDIQEALARRRARSGEET